MAFEEVTIGPCRLICGDAMAIAPMLGHTYALITDPPYGIRLNTNYRRFSGGHRALQKCYPSVVGDAEPFNPLPWLNYAEMILWGANHFPQSLPLGSWLFWDKRASNGHALTSEGEMAWWSQGRSVYYFPHCWHGFARASENSSHLHPTQKPIALMQWCVEKTSWPVFDPFMGSGTTGVACVQLNRSFVGIEIEPRYFDIACRRVEEAYQQMTLFPVVARCVEPQQVPLFAAAGGA